MDSAKAIEKSKKATTIPYPVLLDSDGNLLKALGAGTIPVTFVFDRAQKKILEVIGPLNPKEQDRVRAALAQSLPTRS
jgi:peroxiredoxin